MNRKHCRQIPAAAAREGNLLMNQQIKGFALVFAAGVLWGLIGPLVKILDQLGSNSMLTAFLRMIFAAIIMFIIVAVTKGPSVLRLSKRSMLVCIALGIVSFGLCSIAYNTSITLSGVTIAVVLMSTAPAFGAVASVIVFKERIGLRRGVLYVLSMVGCLMVATGGQIPEGSSLIGILAGLLSGFCYAMTPVFARVSGDDTSPMALNTYSFAVAAVATFPFAQPWTAIPVLLNPELILAALALALFPSVIAYLIYYHGVELISEINLVPVFGTTEIVTGSLLGVLFFGDMLNIVSGLGMVIVFGTIVLLGVSEHFSGVRKAEEATKALAPSLEGNNTP